MLVRFRNLTLLVSPFASAMADPLSIATGVITFIGACNALATTIKKLHRIRKAPAELLELEHELSALRSCTEGIEQLTQTHSRRHEYVIGQIHIGLYVDNARKKIQQIQQFLEQSLIDTSRGSKIRSSALLKWQSEFSRLRQELRDLRSEIGTCISLFNT